MSEFLNFDQSLGRLGLLWLLVRDGSGFRKTENLDFVLSAVHDHTAYGDGDVGISDVLECQRVDAVIEVKPVDAFVTGFAMRLELVMEIVRLLLSEVHTYRTGWRLGGVI
jgi:hypothetical protein